MVRMMGVRHVGLQTENPEQLAEFYQDVMGLQKVGGSGSGDPMLPDGSVFLSSRPDEENHELVLFHGPLAHTAFRVETLSDLREMYRRVLERGLPIESSVNHGCSLAFYFRDPEQNAIEVYWATCIHNHQPYADDLDLTLPEEALLADVERVALKFGLDLPVGWQGAIATTG